MASIETNRRPVWYSRTVGVLKVVLPITSLVLLSLVFLLARTIDPNAAISSAEIDVQERARNPRISGAHYAGVTDDGAALMILADTARSDMNATTRFDVTGLDLTLAGMDGETLDAIADTGVIDRGRGEFELEGALDFNVSPGYQLRTERLTGLLDSTHVVAPGPVSGNAPAGVIDAGSMEYTVNPASGTGYVLVFRSGVRLNYQP